VNLPFTKEVSGAVLHIEQSSIEGMIRVGVAWRDETRAKRIAEADVNPDMITGSSIGVRGMWEFALVRPVNTHYPHWQPVLGALEGWSATNLQKEVI